MSIIPRKEYPRPQFVRKEWLNLNGAWTCELDVSRSGDDRENFKAKKFARKIVVPFPPESKLSGVGFKDFIDQIWYHRKIKAPANWAGKNIILNFGAVFYECDVYIDGLWAGRHSGGNCSFSVDITKHVSDLKEHDLVVKASSDVRSLKQPGGKQSPKRFSHACLYTRTTGIWQTVWMEAVSAGGLKRVYAVPNIDNSTLTVTPEFYAMASGARFKIVISAKGKKVAERTTTAATGYPVELKVKPLKLWSPESPFLYDIEYTVLDAKGRALDRVKSYFGMRKTHTADGKIYFNNKPIYLRTVLDQGFYPDGIWTAPSDAALKNDILLAMKAGFNGARLHQKVFEERFHYWADKLGYLTWAEFASWGTFMMDLQASYNYLKEWRECVVRDRNHPSIIVWTPLNETMRGDPRTYNPQTTFDLYKLTKAIDPSRPVHDTSGYSHVVTDIYSVHEYDQKVENLLPKLQMQADGTPPRMQERNPHAVWAGQPIFCAEYGGVKWIADRSKVEKEGWGYGEEVKSLSEFYRRLNDLTKAIVDQKHMCGFTYTQLTDVEQEQNGIYNYDRTKKFDMGKIKKIFELQPEGYN